jgi:hypothetical protein
MSLPLTPALFTDTLNSGKKKTIKYRKPRLPVKKHNEKRSELMLDADDDDNSSLASFSPPGPPESASKKVEFDNEETREWKNHVEEFTEIGRNTNQLEDNVQFVPAAQNTSNDITSYYGQNSQVIEKLNYIIQMLEDEKDEKTGNVIEELILYGFLGVFMIFMTDSFAKVGKYIR